MAQLLDDIGLHIQMTKVDSNQVESSLFPINTANDVIMDENGNNLVDYIPVAVDSATSPTKSEPIVLVDDSTGTDIIPDSVLANIISA